MQSFLWALALSVLLCCSAGAQARLEKVIFDTDIGDDVDDAYALALLAHQPGIEILGVTTAFGETPKRAEVAAKLLHVMGKDDVPVYAGRASDRKIGRQHDWANGFKSRAIKSTPAIEFMRHELAKRPGEITLIAVGPLTNLGDLLTKYPETKKQIQRIVIMGGAVHAGYNNQSPPVEEWNIKCDPPAARAVYSSGVPLTMAGLEATTMLQLDHDRQKKLFAHGTPTTDALAALTNLWGGNIPVLYDPMAVAFACGQRFCDTEQQSVIVEDSGKTTIKEGAPVCTVLVNPRKDAFLDWYVSALAPKR